MNLAHRPRRGRTRTGQGSRRRYAKLSGPAAAAVSGLLLAAAAWSRPDVAIGVIALAAVFVPLERKWPIAAQPVFRKGWRVDIVHFVVDQVAAGSLVAAAAIVLVPSLERLLPDLGRYTHGPAQWALAAIVGEVLGYWGHRMMHRVPPLWRLHALHHSAPILDWLSPNRRHPLDAALGQAASVVPLLALGLSPPLVVGAFVLRRAQGLFVHANLRWHFMGLRWFVATPEFHHWHHSADPRYYHTNFAGQCPVVDWLFGTLHMPTRSWPAGYGNADQHDPVPEGYLAQLAWPFRGLLPESGRRARSRQPAT